MASVRGGRKHTNKHRQPARNNTQNRQETHYDEEVFSMAQKSKDIYTTCLSLLNLTFKYAHQYTVLVETYIIF